MKKSIAIKTNIKKWSVDKCRGFVRSLIVEPSSYSDRFESPESDCIFYGGTMNDFTRHVAHSYRGFSVTRGASNTISNSFF